MSISDSNTNTLLSMQPTDPPHPCKCSQCDPNFYTIPMQLLFAGKVEYVCRDCQFSTLSYMVVQQHEAESGHRRWYNFPQ
ncbi:hypothetical protein IW148_003507 [Coemansia sp. RSA 1199]|nr:hypothetical protein IW148_003507 [Coemansia sp. RSA 1199]